MDDKYLLICRKCLSEKEGFRTAALEYKEFFLPAIKEHHEKECKHDEGEKEIEPPAKRQKTEEEKKSPALIELDVKPDREEIDVIIDDAFALELKEEHSSYFSRVIKMI